MGVSEVLTQWTCMIFCMSWSLLNFFFWRKFLKKVLFISGSVLWKIFKKLLRRRWGWVFPMSTSFRRRRTASNSEDSPPPVENLYRNPRENSYKEAAPAPPSASGRDATMTCRDRTTEFMSAVKSLQSRQGNGLVQSRSQHLRQHSEFMQIAR